MNKKQYIKPTMQMVELNHKTHLLEVSGNYGVNSNLQGTSNPDDEVDDAW